MTKGPDDKREKKALEKKNEFSYKQLPGELIYAYTICRLDIAVPIITLSQHTGVPTDVHYKALKQVAMYLYGTKHHGITYWRQKPRMDLEEIPHYGTVSKQDQLFKYGDTYGALELHGACDSTWASDRTQRRSMGGIVLMLAGGAVYYRTHLQPTIALSSTEAEFTTMAYARKAALYIR